MGGGGGTNNKGKLLALWMLWFEAKSRNIDEMEIFGDSKIIVEWVARRGNLLRESNMIVRFFEYTFIIYFKV